MYIVAEIGLNHNGDVQLAKRMISVAKSAGCDFVKFQKRTIDLVYTQQELDSPRESPWGTTFRQQKDGLELGKEEYDEVNDFCKEEKIRWFASPWDCQSVDFLQQYNLSLIKVASALLTNFEVLERVRKTGIDIVLSTGMSTEEEVTEAVNFLGEQVKYVLACTSTYPTRVEDINLKKILTLKKQFPDKKVGFSNHHPGILFAASAVLLGAEMIEFHQTLDRSMYGSDQAASIETPGVFKLVNYIRDLEKAAGDGYWRISEDEEKIKRKLRKC